VSCDLLERRGGTKSVSIVAGKEVFLETSEHGVKTSVNFLGQGTR
jgi:hypothetical protein